MRQRFERGYFLNEVSAVHGILSQVYWSGIFQKTQHLQKHYGVYFIRDMAGKYTWHSTMFVFMSCAKQTANLAENNSSVSIFISSITAINTIIKIARKIKKPTKQFGS